VREKEGLNHKEPALSEAEGARRAQRREKYLWVRKRKKDKRFVAYH